MNVNFVILIDNGYVLHDYCEGDVLRETTMAIEKVVEGTRMVALTSTKPVLC
jgi:hypothetical protein